jgi:hypothetical protein
MLGSAMLRPGRAPARSSGFRTKYQQQPASGKGLLFWSFSRAPEKCHASTFQVVPKPRFQPAVPPDSSAGRLHTFW